MLPSIHFTKPVGIDDLPAIVRHGELACEDFARQAVDIDFGNDRDARAVALRVGDAAAGDFVTALVAARRGPRLPFRVIRRCLDHRDVARLLDMAQPEFDRIGIHRCRHFVDE